MTKSRTAAAVENDSHQSEKFKRTARELDCDEDENRWDERLKKVAKGKPEPEKP